MRVKSAAANCFSSRSQLTVIVGRHNISAHHRKGLFTVTQQRKSLNDSAFGFKRAGKILAFLGYFNIESRHNF